MNPDLPASSDASIVACRPFPADPSRRKRLAPLLLPGAILRPWVLLPVWVLPQFLLLVINLQAWGLAAEEVSPSQHTMAVTILFAELISLLGGIATTGALWRRGRTFSRFLGAIPLGLGVVFMAVALNLVDRVIPETLADWMLPRDQWILKQFAFTMPAALFGAIRLLCPDRESAGATLESLGRGVGVTVAFFAACLAAPFVVGPLLSLVHSLPSELEPFGFALVTGPYIALTLLAAGSLLRVCISLYLAARATSPAALSILAAFVAVVGPLGGLWLNAGIPFPANFQVPSIYILALVNGLVLMLPNFSHPLAHRLVWLAQCALFPFTLYFFAVFLPFLPLGPLAMLVVGLGVLIYVPSLLFLLHGFRLIDGYRAEIRDGSKWLPALLGITALLIWPVTYTGQAVRDKATLHGALDYLQYPDYAANARFDGSMGALRSSLTHLDDFKRGIYLPYLSEYYNWLAFDNLVLPQEKLDGLALTFLGEPLPKSPDVAQLDMFGWGRNRARNVTEALNGVSGTRPRADARLEQLQSLAKVEAGAVRVTAALIISNPAAEPTEFSTTIQVPPGVMVSGLWLTIGTRRVPGRLFEKRSALWVYQKITEVRPVPRDPAILRYVGPNLVELRVYPVESAAPRHVEVEFLYPEGLNPRIVVGAGQVIQTPVAERSTASVTAEENGNFNVVLPPTLGLPLVHRQPYFHFLVDVSKGSIFSEAEALLQKELLRISRQFPEVREARLTFVNFETADFRQGELLPIEELLRVPAAQFQPASFKGGFVPTRAIKEVLWRHHLALSDVDSLALTRYPQIVVLTGSDRPKPATDANNLAEFSRWLPDWPGYWEVPAQDVAARYIPLGPGGKAPVNIYQIGGERFAAAANEPASYMSIKPAKGPLDKIEIYDPTTGKFVATGAALEHPASAGYAKAVMPWSLELRRIFEPFRSRLGDLGELLKLCRETGILVPSAAYMVVENTAQWKMLEHTEKKTLKGHEALELSEPTVPEPGTIVLVVLGVGVLVLASRYRWPQWR